MYYYTIVIYTLRNILTVDKKIVHENTATAFNSLTFTLFICEMTK